MNMRNVLIFTSLLALSSCGLFKKADPIMIEKIVMKWDTVYTERITFDTSFVTTPNDTVFITKDKLMVRVIRKFDTIRVFADYKGDTTAVESVVLEQYKTTPNKKGNTWTELFAGLAVVAIVIMAFKVFFDTIFGNK
jgi:hypothetical protein